MPRLALLLITLSVLVLGPRSRAGAQSPAWNSPRVRALVERATARRAQQLADTGLRSYHATAHGYLTFLAQVGEGFREPPKIVKADELALDVYWKAPDSSRQIIVGRRDTLLLPTDINYHRDHLGIVQNNFPNTIRLGEGDEVRDVPHPLSPLGLATYDFAITDSLSIALPGRAFPVYEVKVRPKNDREPAVVGAVYIDPTEDQVVRMAFSFTRASLLDRNLEDVSIVLENSLMEGRFWLPRRQEVEIRRTGTWLDYPARGIIRGRWEICCYEINRVIDPQLFAGASEIVQLPSARIRQYPFKGAILDSLPDDVRAVSDADVRRVQEEARSLVRAQALSTARTSSLAARSVSDFVAFDRVQGLSLGAGVRHLFGDGVSLALAGRYGIDDEKARGRVTLGLQRASGIGLRLSLYRTLRDARDVAQSSAFRNSIAAQEFGTDLTQPFQARGYSLALDLAEHAGLRWTAEAAYETQGGVAVHATPATGAFEPTPLVRALRGPRFRLTATRPTALSLFGTELRAEGELRAGRSVPNDEDHSNEDALRAGFLRAFALLHVERPFAAGRLVLETSAAGFTNGGASQPQDLVFLGGPVSAPGYDAFRFASRFGATQRVEWRTPVPAFPISLGRFGTAPASLTLAPYAHTVFLAETRSVGPFYPARPGWYPSLGVGVLGLFDLIRFDVARGLRGGRWTFGVDVSRDFWGVL